jgi:TatD DNase family protein
MMPDMNPMELLDSHAHLDFGKLEKNLDAVKERAWAAGVRNIITIGSGKGVEGAFDALKLAVEDFRIWSTVGVHPHDADLGVNWNSDPDKPVASSVFKSWEERCERALWRHRALAVHPKVVAIGEVGLDYFYDHSPRQLQRELFRRSIRLAVGLGLPLVIHARDAEAEVVHILADEGAQRVGGVIHCFSGNPELAQRALEMGFCFGLTGVLTFPKAEALRQVVKEIPMERLLVETDSPYLAPVPHRGKQNEPAFVAHVVDELARLKGLSAQETALVTSANARRLFGIEGLEQVGNGKIAYRLGESCYLNITNRCTLACRFCLKHSGYDLAGYSLGLFQEPSELELLVAVEEERAQRVVSEVVFCGIGEPLLRPDVVKNVGRKLRKLGIRVRVDTDGLASLVFQRDVLSELKGCVDAFSVSLNAHDAQTYARVCPSSYGPDAFGAVCDFIRQASHLCGQTTASVVRQVLVDETAAEELATSLGAGFHVRG